MMYTSSYAANSSLLFPLHVLHIITNSHGKCLVSDSAMVSVKSQMFIQQHWQKHPLREQHDTLHCRSVQLFLYLLEP